ncbi:phage GP46 family protein [Roseospirillum parvum]|uniref:Mu-like prophage protein gp46 n=1 Tax=Roseospirillum parvum TaxID=83401 RepID=A0A1G8G1R6_9PROT|nr:phage GP46 family protein [Roseospirillum parvum]SDH88323.1 Mu-like prophage protein gp46 [Roseospirillum parvum]
MDLALAYDSTLVACDLALDGDLDVATDAGLETAVLVSLFTDRRTNADDRLPDDPSPAGSVSDRRGWWGDALPPGDEAGATRPGWRLGSRLWLLSREKQSGETARRAREYAEEALAWLIEDGVAAAVTVTAEWVAPGVLGLGVVIARPAQPDTRYDLTWKAQADAI